jgi:signal transduction histidine kinase
MSAHSPHDTIVDARAELSGASSALEGLRRLEEVFGEWRQPEQHAFVQACERAREHALDLLSGGAEDQRSNAALLVAATELFGALKVELAASPGDTAHLIARLERELGIDRLELARAVLRSPELLAVSPHLAAEVLLALMVAFAPLRSVSLWTLDAGDRVSCTRHVGDGRPSRGAAQLAKRLLAGLRPEVGPRRLLLGFAVGPAGEPTAALVATSHQGERERCRLFITQALPLLSAIVERERLLAENDASERALVEASERKLTRLGFDLHDGPVQEVALLAQDLRLFGEQLEDVLVTRRDRQLFRGRLEDLHAQVVALDAELRRLAGEVQTASVPLVKAFPTALRERVQAFATRTGIQPQLTLEGDMEMLSTSQQIAILNIVQEALSNIREHARASSVEISVFAREGGAEATITDDGRGFEMESTLMRAAREGRIGLVAINERVRLLGGRCHIASQPGGPTTISVSFDRWAPGAAGEQQGHPARRSRWARGSRASA